MTGLDPTQSRMPTKARGWNTAAKFAGWSLVLLAAVAVGLLHGSTPIAPDQVWHALLHPHAGILSVVIWQIRFPRIVAAALVGGSLAVAGAVMQALLQNPLADPYVVGASAGAGLGAIGAETVAPGMALVAPGAFVGALVAVFLAWSLSRGRGRSPMLTLLLAGYALSVLFSAVSTFLMLENQTALTTIFAWELGGIHGMTWPVVRTATIIMAGAGLLLLGHVRTMNALILGEDVAHGVGIAVGRTEAVLLLSASLLTAAAVYLSGLIGFVGLVVPHVVRRLSGPEHQRLIPFSVLAGATFMVLADTLAEHLPPLGTVPVGLITAVIGGPYFLYVLARQPGRKFS